MKQFLKDLCQAFGFLALLCFMVGLVASGMFSTGWILTYYGIYPENPHYNYRAFDAPILETE